MLPKFQQSWNYKSQKLIPRNFIESFNHLLLPLNPLWKEDLPIHDKNTPMYWPQYGDNSTMALLLGQLLTGATCMYDSTNENKKSQQNVQVLLMQAIKKKNDQIKANDSIE